MITTTVQNKNVFLKLTGRTNTCSIKQNDSNKDNPTSCRSERAGSDFKNNEIRKEEKMIRDSKTQAVKLKIEFVTEQSEA